MTSEGNEAFQRIHGSHTDRGVVDPLNVVCGVLTAVVFLEKRMQPGTYLCPKCETNDRRRIVRVGRVVIAGGEWSVDDLTQHTDNLCEPRALSFLDRDEPLRRVPREDRLGGHRLKQRRCGIRAATAAANVFE